VGIETIPSRTSTHVSELTENADGNTAGMPMAMPCINHELNTLKAAASAVVASACAREAAAAGIEIKAEDPRLVALVADGAMPAEFRSAAARASATGKGVAWFFAAVSGMRRDVTNGKAQEGHQTGSGSPNYPMLPRAYTPTSKT
jgi:hypothetical protein